MIAYLCRWWDSLTLFNYKTGDNIWREQLILWHYRFIIDWIKSVGTCSTCDSVFIYEWNSSLINQSNLRSVFWRPSNDLSLHWSSNHSWRGFCRKKSWFLQQFVVNLWSPWEGEPGLEAYPKLFLILALLHIKPSFLSNSMYICILWALRLRCGRFAFDCG